MAGHLDSQSVFTVRLTSLGIDDASINQLISSGINTMARLAYICSIQPGVSDDNPFFVALAAALRLGGPDDIPVGDKAAYRRAWFESSTVAIAEVRSKIEATSEDAPKRMPKEERNARHKKQQAKLGGIKIEGVVEPSHALLDAVWAMREENSLRYLQLESCTSRSQEILGVKKESFVKAESGSGHLKQVTRDLNPTADLTTEYRVRLAFQRRALAFDACEICEFSILDEVNEYLYSLVMKEPLDTHHGISISQVMRADRQLFIRLIELTREGINPDAHGRRPMEVFLAQARMDPLFSATLQPLPKAQSQAAVHDRQKSFQETPYSRGKGKGKGKQASKGKGGGKSSSKGQKGVPEELKGLRSSTKSGRPFCWNFNLAAGCQDAKVGTECWKGFHGCMKCGANNHGLQSCDRK